MILSSWFNVGVVLVKIVASLYRTVARTYNLMLQFVEGFKSAGIVESLAAIKENIYVLVAVFMLFRIIVTMLEYLVDPDKVSDKNIGAGKFITRILVSLILVIASPFLFDFSKKVETDLLNSNSILYKLFNISESDETPSANESRTCEIKKRYDKGEIKTLDQLAAAAKGCKTSPQLTNEISSVARSIDGRNYNIVKIADYDVIDTIRGIIGMKTYVIIQNIGGAFNEITSAIIAGKIPDEVRIDDFRYIQLFDEANYIILYGDALFADVAYTDIVDTDGADFARSIVASFSSETYPIMEESFGNGYKFLENSDADDEIARRVEEDELQLDSFMCLVCGIAVTFIILILCVEVVIREFKLIILEVFSPIAFISYMNPNDKILGNWFKKYIGCYLDLFIKLLAIRLGVFLIAQVHAAEFSFGFLGTIIFYIGIFLFIKTIPNLITDVLGIKNMGGSFKDSMNALKTAAFTGAGAVAGAGAGLITGVGKGGNFFTATGGLFGGAFRGAAGGAKGNILQGATTQAKRNRGVRQANQDGSSWFDRMRARAGVNLTRDEDNQIKEHKRQAQIHQAAVEYADQAKSYVEQKLGDGKGDDMVNSKYAKLYRQEKEELDRLEAVKKGITRESIAAGISHDGITDSVYNQIVDEEYNKAVGKANDAYNEKWNKFYKNCDGTGKGLKDLAVAEYYESSGDEGLASMKNAAKIKFAAYGDALSDVNVDVWENAPDSKVKGVSDGKKSHKGQADAENAQAYRIENSEGYLARKASQNSTNDK